MILLRLGWRNLWRNPRRSWITISAVATAYTFLILISSLGEGLMTQMLDNGTDLLLGHLQVHHRQYLPDRNLYDWIEGNGETDLDSLLALLRRFPHVVGAAPRVYGFGLISSGEKSSGVQMIGVDPHSEGRVSSLLDNLVKGEELAEAPSKGLLLGETLARSLSVQPGSEVAIVAQSADGTLGNDLYQVTGILRTVSAHLERSLVLAHWKDLQELLVLDVSQVHELALRVDDPLVADAVSSQLNASRLLPFDAEAVNAH